MEKEKELPVYILFGEKFLVDVELLELRQLDDPANTISFLEMEDKGTQYRLDYYLNDAVNVDILPLKELDPEGMAAKYGCSVEEMKDKTDFEIMVDQKALNQHLAGVLPEIDLARHQFYVDWSKKELRAKDDMAAWPLNLRTMDMNSDGTAYICAYHIPTKNECRIDKSIIEMPKDVVALEIPYELTLDPVSVAREYGLNETTFLRRFPILKELKAKVTPLCDTDLPKLIESNRKKLEEQKIQQLSSKGRKLK